MGIPSPNPIRLLSQPVRIFRLLDIYPIRVDKHTEEEDFRVQAIGTRGVANQRTLLDYHS